MNPTEDKPALLSLEEVETLFHEFGHALHGLLSQCSYPSLSGTNVCRDFVELPSQVMENWAEAPEVMKSYALHDQTGEPIPDELVQKIQNARLFNPDLSSAFRKYILEAGDTDDPMTLYKKFRGREPGIIRRLKSKIFRRLNSPPALSDHSK